MSTSLRNISDRNEVAIPGAATGVSHARWIIYAIVGGLLLLWGSWWTIDAVRYVASGRFTIA